MNAQRRHSSSWTEWQHPGTRWVCFLLPCPACASSALSPTRAQDTDPALSRRTRLQGPLCPVRGDWLVRDPRQQSLVLPDVSLAGGGRRFWHACPVSDNISVSHPFTRENPTASGNSLVSLLLRKRPHLVTSAPAQPCPSLGNGLTCSWPSCERVREGRVAGRRHRLASRHLRGLALSHPEEGAGQGCL